MTGERHAGAYALELPEACDPRAQYTARCARCTWRPTADSWEDAIRQTAEHIEATGHQSVTVSMARNALLYAVPQLPKYKPARVLRS